MSIAGNVRIGGKAPDFQCEAVINGSIEEVSLSTYIHPAGKTNKNGPEPPWLILLFIPAAFSFVCPTEVLAFQNCLEEFKDRNCNVVFVSVDTKHALWHWQNVPRQYGGLGPIDIPLLSDSNHRLSRDYGVLIEEEGVSLRGMFIIDNEGIVQQVTLNNLTVGRSVLEALRLLEAFQSVARHGVLCPIDWKPTKAASDTMNTISNTLTSSYADRLANLQKEFEGIQVTDLDAKHKSLDGAHSTTNGASTSSTSASPGATTVRPARSHSNPQPQTTTPCARPAHTSPIHSHRNDCLPRIHTTPPPSALTSHPSFTTTRSSSAPHSSFATPTPTPTNSHPPPSPRRAPTARHARGTQPLDPHALFSSSSSPAPSIFNTLIRRNTDTLPGHSTAPPPPSTPAQTRLARQQNTFESRRGSHVVLEFADPTSSPPSVPATPMPLSRAASYTGAASYTSGTGNLHLGQPTRLQATFEALKKMGSGLASPRGEWSPRKGGDMGKSGLGGGGEGRSVGYFDGVDGVEA